jgi:hypothetical protein
MTRTNIVKRHTGGYRVIEYPPNFGGFKVHEVFEDKKSAEAFARKIRRI